MGPEKSYMLPFTAESMGWVLALISEKVIVLSQDRGVFSDQDLCYEQGTEINSAVYLKEAVGRPAGKIFLQLCSWGFHCHLSQEDTTVTLQVTCPN